ncbi:MAG TPA: EamA family transporter, partial [Myxococcota bacterium]|nr:EamA family transporter [Myxococcota bacterium]
MTIESIPAAGELFSAASAILWALSLVLFRRAGTSMGPATLNLYKGLVAIVFLIPTMLILGVDMTPDNVTARDW